MKVTVSECLRLPSLREAMLIGGAKGLERSVSSVSVLEWPEVELLSDDVIAGKEVLLSALIQIKGDVEKQCRLLRHLCSMGTCLLYTSCFDAGEKEELHPRIAHAICYFGRYIWWRHDHH